MKKIIALTILLCAASLYAAAQEQNLVVSRSGNGPSAPIPGNKWRFAVDAGYSYRLGKMADGVTGDLEDFVRKMRSGIGYGADIHYFPVEAFGFGAKFQGRHASRSENGLNDKVNTVYVGPSAMARSFSRNDKGAWVFGYSMGYVHYGEKVTYNGENTDFSQGGFATTLEAGYDFRIGRSSFFGVKFSLLAGSVKLAGVDEMENVSSMNLGVGLRF